MEDKVEVIEIWAKAKDNKNASAISYPSGDNLELVYQSIGGKIIILKKDYFLEKKIISKELADQLSTQSQ